MSGFIYTANEAGASLSLVALATGSVRSVPVGFNPHNVQISTDGRWVLATGPMPAAGRGRLLVLDAATLDPATGASIEVGPDPAHVVTDRAGRFAYVTDMKLDRVLVVEIARREVVGEIETDAAPHGIRLSPDGRELYVACITGNSVSVIDVGQGREVARIPVGRAPVQVAFTADGRRVYVSLSDEDAVAVMDVATRAVVARIPVGHLPIQLYGTPDSRLMYVANEGTEASPDSTVSVIDTRTDRVVATVVSGRGPHGVVVSDDGGHAFVTNVYDNTVSAIEVATQRVVRTIRVGKEPNGITYRPAP
jgi:YVTN family beta-propeller protein